MTDSELDTLVRWNNRMRCVRFFPAPKFDSPTDKFAAKCRCFLSGHKYEYNGNCGALILASHHDMYRYTCKCCGKEKLSFTYEGKNL